MSGEKFVRFPYPGLRPFLQEEADLFFGRESQIETLIQKLLDTRFLSVVGTSGSGKSSLARAGLFPVLEDEYGDSRDEHFNVVKIRPGQQPYLDIARQLCAFAGPTKGVDPKMQEAFALTTLKRGPLGLQKWLTENKLSGRLLLFVDQFEEVFRFRSLDPNEAIRFVKMLIASAQQTEVPIYVCLTMRSEFLGRCTEFRDLPEMINTGQYLIPRLRRNELRETIELPAKIAGTSLSPRLSTHLVNEVGDNPDQLPILQHALSRAFQRWRSCDTPDAPIDLAHMSDIGGLNDALGVHAEEIFDSLNPAEQKAALGLARAITVMEGTVALRRPLRLDTIVSVSGEPRQLIINVIEAYRVEGASFLLPGLPEELTDACVIDISHESLIRQWPRLWQLVIEEAEDAKSYHRLSESAKRNNRQLALYHDGKAEKPGEDYLLTGMDLFAARNLRSKNKLNESWAVIQGDSPADFAASAEFLKLSEHYDMRAQKRKKRARQTWRMFGVVMAMVGIALAIMLKLMVNWYNDAKEAKQITLDQQSAFLSGYANLLLDADPTMNLSLLDYLVQDSAVHREDSLLEISFGSYFHKVMIGEHAVYRKKEVGDQVFTKAIYSDSGDELATASNKNIILWKKAGMRQGRYYKDTIQIDTFQRKLEFSPQQNLFLGVGVNNKLHVWPSEFNGKARPILEKEDVSLASFIVKEDSLYLLIVSRSGEISECDLGGRCKQLIKLPEGQRNFRDMYANANGNWLYLPFSERGEFRQMTFERSRGKFRERSNPFEKMDKVKSLHCSPRRKAHEFFALASMDDNSAHIMRLGAKASNAKPAVLEGFYGDIRDADFSPDGRYLLVIAGNNKVSLWSTTGNKISDLFGHRGEVWDAHFSRDSKAVVTVSSDGSMRLWNLPVGSNPGFNTANTRFLSYLDDEAMAACMVGNQLQVWDLEADTVMQTWTAKQAGKVIDAGLTEEKQVIVASWRGRRIQWKKYDLNGKLLEQKLGSNLTRKISEIEFSKDGAFAAYAVKGDSTKVVRMFDKGKSSCESVVLSGLQPFFLDNRVWLTSSDNQVRQKYRLKACLADVTIVQRQEVPVKPAPQPPKSSSQGRPVILSGKALDVARNQLQQKQQAQTLNAAVIYSPEPFAEEETSDLSGRMLMGAYRNVRDSLGLNGPDTDSRFVTAIREFPGGNGYALALSDQSLDLYDRNKLLLARIDGFGHDITYMHAFPHGDRLLLIFRSGLAKVIPVMPNMPDMQQYMRTGPIFHPCLRDFEEFGIDASRYLNGLSCPDDINVLRGRKRE